MFGQDENMKCPCFVADGDEMSDSLLAVDKVPMCVGTNGWKSETICECWNRCKKIQEHFRNYEVTIDSSPRDTLNLLGLRFFVGKVPHLKLS